MWNFLTGKLFWRLSTARTTDEAPHPLQSVSDLTIAASAHSSEHITLSGSEGIPPNVTVIWVLLIQCVCACPGAICGSLAKSH